MRELALPGVRHVLAARVELVAPGELAAGQAAARGVLPLGLGGDLLAGPLRVGERIRPRDMGHRMIKATAQRRVRTARVPPVGAGHVRPPLVRVTKVHRMRRRREHYRNRYQQGRVGTGIHGRVRGPLGHRPVPGGLDEDLELGIGHRMRVHPESVDADRVGRSLLGVVAVRPHDEPATGNPHHVVGLLPRGGRYAQGVGDDVIQLCGSGGDTHRATSLSAEMCAEMPVAVLAVTRRRSLS